MRDLDKELQRVITFAEENDNIRGLVLQGSYVNDNAPKDYFSDLDPLFYVVDVDAFLKDSKWKEYFGKPISFFHDDWDTHDGLKSYTRLTIYSDGFKMDFGFSDVKLAKYANEMPLYKVYLDKDNIIPVPQVTDDSKFFGKKPSNQEYQDILRDFFFDSSYVVKTIYRDEIMFNQYMQNILHKKIQKLVEWYIGCKNDFSVNTGSFGRYMKRYLSDKEYQMIKDTYSGPDYEETKRALIKSFEVVRYFGSYVGVALQYEYPQKHEEDLYNYCIDIFNNYIG